MTGASTLKEAKVEMVYGWTVVNPACHVKIIAPPPPTWRDAVAFWWYELVVPSFLVACAVTSFQIAFGLI